MLITLGGGEVMGTGNGTLDYGAVLGPGNGTLGNGAVLEAIVGRDDASIFCRVFMACNFSSMIDNGDAGAGFLRASLELSTNWR